LFVVVVSAYGIRQASATSPYVKPLQALPDANLASFLRELTAALDTASIPYMLTGACAIITAPGEICRLEHRSVTVLSPIFPGGIDMTDRP